MTPSSKLQEGIEKLSSLNYQYWSVKMQIVTTAYRERLVSKCTQINQPDANDVEGQARWKEPKNHAMTLILLPLEDSHVRDKE